MVVVWADLAPAFAFSATPLSGQPNFTAFLSSDSSQIDAIQRALVKLYNGSATARDGFASQPQTGPVTEENTSPPNVTLLEQ